MANGQDGNVALYDQVLAGLREDMSEVIRIAHKGPSGSPEDDVMCRRLANFVCGILFQSSSETGEHNC